MSGMSREKPALDRARCMDKAWSLYESSGERIRNAGVRYPDSIVSQPILPMVLCAKESSSSSSAASASVRYHETEDRWPLWLRRTAIERRERSILMCRPSRKGSLRRWHGISKKGEADAKSRWAVAKFRDRIETVRPPSIPKLGSASSRIADPHPKCRRLRISMAGPGGRLFTAGGSAASPVRLPVSFGPVALVPQRWRIDMEKKGNRLWTTKPHCTRQPHGFCSARLEFGSSNKFT